MIDQVAIILCLINGIAILLLAAEVSRLQKADRRLEVAIKDLCRYLEDRNND